MNQKVKIQAAFEIPEDKVIVDRSEYEKLQNSIDDGCWWTSKDVESRYKHKMDWLKENILLIPSYKSELDAKNGGCVHYADPENGRYWSFEPTRFKEFMSKHFTEINQ